MPRMRLFSAAGLPDRMHVLEGLGRYTRFVRFSKLTLLMMIGVILGLVVILPIVNKDSSGVRIALTASQEAPPAKPVMQKPRFQGLDKQMQPYTVTADTAIQQDSNTVLLNNVQSDITFKDNAWVSIRADQGTLRLSEESLQLLGKVQMFYDAGYEVRTESVDFDLAKGTANSDTALEGQGNIGYIKSSGFTATDRGRIITFKGPVTMVLYPGREG